MGVCLLSGGHRRRWDEWGLTYVSLVLLYLLPFTPRPRAIQVDIFSPEAIILWRDGLVIYNEECTRCALIFVLAGNWGLNGAYHARHTSRTHTRVIIQWEGKKKRSVGYWAGHASALMVRRSGPGALRLSLWLVPRDSTRACSDPEATPFTRRRATALRTGLELGGPSASSLISSTSRSSWNAPVPAG